MQPTTAETARAEDASLSTSRARGCVLVDTLPEPPLLDIPHQPGERSDPKGTDAINVYREELRARAVPLAQTAQKILGAHQCTYLHDLCFGFWYGAGLIGAYLRATMEGFEHANKDVGAIMLQQVSMGGRGKRHAMIQALVLRRATTNSRIDDNQVNQYSKARRVGLSEAAEKRRLQVTDALEMMRALRKELAEIEKVHMETGEAMSELEKHKK